MAEVSKSTVEHSKADIAANPNHVQAQQFEALTPAASVPQIPALPDSAGKNISDAFSGDVKDEEGIVIGKKKSVRTEKKVQKKIAVLTSGGDSAGMNAAGECTSPFFGGARAEELDGI